MQQLRQRVIASYHLGPMDAQETRAYIEHRLATVGWNGDPSFDDGAHAAIFAYTGGIPRKVNTLMRPRAADGLPGRDARLHGSRRQHRHQRHQRGIPAARSAGLDAGAGAGRCRASLGG
jgi:hypothetical protein